MGGTIAVVRHFLEQFQALIQLISNAGGTTLETLRGSQIPWVWETGGAHHAPGAPCKASRGEMRRVGFSCLTSAAHLRVGRGQEGDENEES